MRSALLLLALLPATTVSHAVTHHVPDSIATVAAALAVASVGDTVLVEPGTYPELIVMVDGVALLAASADRPILDGRGAGTVLTATACGPSTMIRGFTFRNGASATTGGGASVVGSSLTIENCRFESNSAAHGGGLSGEASAFALFDCEFEENSATQTGGAISITSVPSPFISGCTVTNNEAFVGGAMAVRNGCEPEVETSVFVGNRADQGAALWYDFLTGGTVRGCTFVSHETFDAQGGTFWLNAVSAPVVTENIVAFGLGGGAMFTVAGTSATLGCNDVFGNVGGDGLGGVIDLGTNFSADPLFCSAADGDYSLRFDSPCLPNGPCGLVGANPEGNCDVAVGSEARIDARSWAWIKVRYRE